MKKTTYVWLILLCLLVNDQLNAQKLQFHTIIPKEKNEVGMEIGGNSLLYSVYYQRSLFRKDNIQFNIRIGGTIYPSPYQDKYSPGVEVNAGAYILPNVLLYRKRHAWEFGVGFNMLASFSKERDYDYNLNSFQTTSDNVQTFLVTPQIGYRLYFKNSRFYFRTALSTFILVGSHQAREDDLDVEPKWLPWGAAGFGYNF